MRTILLFGAGKSATVLIDYLITSGPGNDWKLILVDADLQLAKAKLKNSVRDIAVSLDAEDTEQRGHYISQSDIVISLLPPTLHSLVAQDCLRFKKKFAYCFIRRSRD